LKPASRHVSPFPSSISSRLSPRQNPQLKSCSTSAVHSHEDDLSVTFIPVVPTAYQHLQTIVGNTVTQNWLTSTTGDAQAANSITDQPNPSEDPFDGPHRPPTPELTASISTNSASRSRTPSFASIATVSSSEGPATPRNYSPLLSPSLPGLNRALSDLEDRSKFRVSTLCVACKKTGNNFPSCSRCGEMWCSRSCRVSSTLKRGGKHSCSGSSLAGIAPEDPSSTVRASG